MSDIDLEKMAPNLTKRVDVVIAIANRVYDNLDIVVQSPEVKAAKIGMVGRITTAILSNEEVHIRNL